MRTFTYRAGPLVAATLTALAFVAMAVFYPPKTGTRCQLPVNMPCVRVTHWYLPLRVAVGAFGLLMAWVLVRFARTETAPWIDQSN